MEKAIYIDAVLIINSLVYYWKCIDTYMHFLPLVLLPAVELSSSWLDHVAIYNDVIAIDIWHRRKLRQTEMECEYLKRWFVSLTEQNRRLQREVEELRALKVGPPTVITPHMSSKPLLASTLTVCPCCERVTTTSAPTLSTKVVLVPPLQPR